MAEPQIVQALNDKCGTVITTLAHYTLVLIALFGTESHSHRALEPKRLEALVRQVYWLTVRNILK